MTDPRVEEDHFCDVIANEITSLEARQSEGRMRLDAQREELRKLMKEQTDATAVGTKGSQDEPTDHAQEIETLEDMMQRRLKALHDDGIEANSVLLFPMLPSDAKPMTRCEVVDLAAKQKSTKSGEGQPADGTVTPHGVYGLVNPETDPEAFNRCTAYACGVGHVESVDKLNRRCDVADRAIARMSTHASQLETENRVLRLEVLVLKEAVDRLLKHHHSTVTVPAGDVHELETESRIMASVASVGTTTIHAAALKSLNAAAAGPSKAKHEAGGEAGATHHEVPSRPVTYATAVTSVCDGCFRKGDCFPCPWCARETYCSVACQVARMASHGALCNALRGSHQGGEGQSTE